MYNNWTLTDNIVIVLKKDTFNRAYGYPQGYVVNPSDKKMLERAKKWGVTYAREVDENGNYTCKQVQPEVITLENKGFTLELFDSAHCSSQGGKLSFWNCLITHENVKAVIGVNANLLLCLLKQSDFHSGKCLNQLCFARNNGDVGLLHEGMKEYKEAVSDKQLKEKMKKGKTTKWQVGNHYKTATIDDIYLGRFYKPIVSFDIKCESIYSIKDAMLLRNEQYKKLSEYARPYESQYIDLYELKLDKKNQAHIAYKDAEHTDNLDRLNIEKAKEHKNILDYLSVYDKTPSRTCETGKYAVEANNVGDTLITLLNKLRNDEHSYVYFWNMEKLSITDSKEYNSEYIDSIVMAFNKKFGDNSHRKFVVSIETPEEKFATIEINEALDYIKNYLSN